jgi:HlyD family secretion protein
MNRALVNNDASLAGRRQLEANYLSGESDRAIEQLSRRTLRSDIAGTIATPHLENVVGKKLEAGDAVMEVVNTGEVTVDLAIAERDVVLLKTGAPANIKLEGFPTKIFRGTVGIISPASGVAADHRVFFARVRLANPDGKIKTGMQGYGKIYAGLRPVGYVLFRDVALWVWSKAWNWFGW